MAQSSSWTQQQQRHPMYTILTHHRAPPPQLDLNLRSNRAVISCLRVHLRQKKEERTIVDAWGWDFRSPVAFPFAWPILQSTQALASTIFGSLCPPSTHHSSSCSGEFGISGVPHFSNSNPLLCPRMRWESHFETVTTPKLHHSLTDENDGHFRQLEDEKE